MNLYNLIACAVGVVLAAAAAGYINDLQMWVWKAQAKLLYESRSSTWGSPRFFSNGTPHASAATNQIKNQISKPTTGRKIHLDSRSNYQEGFYGTESKNIPSQCRLR